MGETLYGKIGILILALIIAGLLGWVIVVTFSEMLPEDDILDWCYDNKQYLTCEQAMDCYNECDKLGWITHQQNCRDRHKAKIWQCYGGGG